MLLEEKRAHLLSRLKKKALLSSHSSDFEAKVRHVRQVNDDRDEGAKIVLNIITDDSLVVSRRRVNITQMIKHEES